MGLVVVWTGFLDDVDFIHNTTPSSPTSSSGSFNSATSTPEAIAILTETFEHLSLGNPPEEEEETTGIAELSSFLSHLTDPLQDIEQLQHPILDWEISSSLHRLPHSSYSLASPKVIRDLHLGLISPANIRGFHLTSNLENRFLCPAHKRHQGLLTRAILQEDLWNRAILAVPQSAFLISSPSTPTTSTRQEAVISKDDTTSLSATQIMSLPSLIEETMVPAPLVSLDTPPDDGFHPGSPWVRASTYLFTQFPLATRHFETPEGSCPMTYIYLSLQDSKPYIFGTVAKDKPIYAHPLHLSPVQLTNYKDIIKHRADLPKLHQDYPFNYLVNLALIAINDPGLFADIHHYRQRGAKAKALNVKKEILSNFKCWYKAANDRAKDNYSIYDDDVAAPLNSFKEFFSC